MIIIKKYILIITQESIVEMIDLFFFLNISFSIGFLYSYFVILSLDDNILLTVIYVLDVNTFYYFWNPMFCLSLYAELVTDQLRSTCGWFIIEIYIGALKILNNCWDPFFLFYFSLLTHLLFFYWFCTLILGFFSVSLFQLSQ